MALLVIRGSGAVTLGTRTKLCGCTQLGDILPHQMSVVSDSGLGS